MELPRILVLVVSSLIALQARSEPPATQRTLSFPPDRSLGVLYVRDKSDDPQQFDYDPQKWRRVGEAFGDVTIPPNVVVRLDVGSVASEDLSPLRKLPPDAIQMLMLGGSSDTAFQHVAALTDLRAIDLRGANITNDGFAVLAKLPKLQQVQANGSIGDAGVAHLVNLPNLRTLALWQGKVTDACTDSIAKMPAIEDVELGFTDITDRGLETLAKSRTIRKLTLAECAITDAGLTHLKAMPDLEELNLEKTHISDAGLVNLEGLSKLKFLELRFNPLGDEALRHVGKLRNLETLSFSSGQFTDDGLAPLEELHRLKRLYISSNDFSAAGIAHLAKLTQLERLDLSGDKIDDSAAEVVASMPSLKEVWIQNCRITDAGLAKIAKLPNLHKLFIGDEHITWQGLNCLAKAPALVDLRISRLGGTPTLKPLAPLKNLTWLEIEVARDQHLDESELTNLAGLTKLTYLRIENVGVSDAGFANLAAMTELNNLNVYCIQGSSHVTIDDAGLASLARMKKLEYLQISGHYTDAAIEHLAKLPSLRWVNLMSGISDAGWKELSHKLPSLQNYPHNDQDGPKLKPMPKVGQAAPDFSVTTIDGKPLRLSDLRGKVVLLHFYGTWCAPCVASTPGLKKLHDRLAQKHGERFAMISLSFDEPPHLPVRHAEFYKLNWLQVALGEKATSVQTDYGVEGAPTYFLIGPDGKIASVDRDWDEIVRQTDALLP